MSVVGFFFSGIDASVLGRLVLWAGGGVGGGRVGGWGGCASELLLGDGIYLSA